MALSLTAQIRSSFSDKNNHSNIQQAIPPFSHPSNYQSIVQATYKLIKPYSSSDPSNKSIEQSIRPAILSVVHLCSDSFFELSIYVAISLSNQSMIHYSANLSSHAFSHPSSCSFIKRSIYVAINSFIYLDHEPAAYPLICPSVPTTSHPSNQPIIHPYFQLSSQALSHRSIYPCI